VAQVLRDFGFASLKLKARDFERAGYAIQLGRPPYRIDILTSIDAVNFAAAFRRRIVVIVDGMKLPFIGLSELVANKRAAARPQDLADVAKLETRQFIVAKTKNKAKRATRKRTN
jgi:hypothetical protein